MNFESVGECFESDFTNAVGMNVFAVIVIVAAVDRVRIRTFSIQRF